MFFAHKFIFVFPILSQHLEMRHYLACPELILLPLLQLNYFALRLTDLYSVRTLAYHLM